MSFAIGSIVRARGREWVVLPESASEDELLVVRPLGGGDGDVAGIYMPLERVEPAGFPDPEPSGELGNHRSCELLRNAVRLGLRAGAGPFRSLARIAVEPRPYQLVPLLMALRQDPVRMLLADDVGIGKTVEALLIARELLDRGEIERVAVLCPPHLAEQWQRAMSEQFGIEATLVLPSTAARLDRECRPGESPFDHHRHVVVSLDYVKTEARVDTFVHGCPDFVIVDEAHGCTDVGAGARGAAQLRHRLLSRLVDAGAENPALAERNRGRHLLLVTATPHSGNPESFRSLLRLLDPRLAELPDDLSGEANRRHRELLARYVVQRRRGDVRDYLALAPGQETPFPDREQTDATYTLHADYSAFFRKVIRFCRDRVLDSSLGEARQRVRWWSALALLRCLGSSPAAAAATLRSRAAAEAGADAAEADALGRRTVLDADDVSLEGADVPYGSEDPGDDEPATAGNAASSPAAALRRLAVEAEALAGARDAKLGRGVTIVEGLLRDGFSPIVFCRFIPTVGYVAEGLRRKLGNAVQVEAVTGDLPPEEREARVDRLVPGRPRVLVCTDCLSEGINLQHRFDAVIHYDLSWNPTRHEQRDGRVDRFGQPAGLVRSVTFYGADNPIDLLVREKLVEKHRAILRTTGVAVPVPAETDRLVEALVRSVFFGRDEPSDRAQLKMAFVDELPAVREVNVAWERSAEREKRSRALFAQHAIPTEEVAAELEASRRVLGGELDVERFTIEALRSVGAAVGEKPSGAYDVDLAGVPEPVRTAAGEMQMTVTFRPGGAAGAVTLGRTSALPRAVATFVAESALDTRIAGPGRRCGVVRTADVGRRSTLVLLRARYTITSAVRGEGRRELLAEDVLLAAFEGSPDAPAWLDDARAEALLRAAPAANVDPALARDHLGRILAALPALRDALHGRVRARGQELREAHERVRKAATWRQRITAVEPYLPADVLGVYVFLPAAGVTA